MDETLMGIDLGKYPGPELNGRFEGGRAREQLGIGGCEYRGADKQQ